MGVSLYSDDFAFYQVLIAVYAAYVVRDPKDFLWLMAFMAATTIAPLFYVDQSFYDSAPHPRDAVRDDLLGGVVLICATRSPSASFNTGASPSRR